MVGAENVVDYVLYHLNKTGRFGYVDYMKLDRPYDDVRVLMAKAALSLNFTKDAYDLEKGESAACCPDHENLQRSLKWIGILACKTYVFFPLLQATELLSRTSRNCLNIS